MCIVHAKEVFMFIEIRPYEKERLSVRFKAEGEDFSKILQAIKKVPNRAWIPALPLKILDLLIESLMMLSL